MAEDSRSSTAAWVRVALPSVAGLIFVALLAVLTFTPLATKLLGDAGIGWHIRTGQMVAATHAVPRVDPFSSSMAGQPWFAWEWLYDVVVGELEAHLGLNGVVWLTAVVIAAVFAWLFRLLIERGTNLPAAVGLTLLAVGASMIHFLARPHVLSWLFTLAWFRVLDSSEKSEKGRRQLWLLALLMILWVNVHGGFLVGFILLGIFWVSAAWTWFRARSDRIEDVLQRIAAAQRSRTLFSVGVLSAVASLVNPYGWRLHAHILSYLSNRFLMNHIEEFQSPNFHGWAARCFVVLILFTLAAFAARGRALRMSEVLTALFAVYAGLYASRNIPASAVLLALVAGPLLCGAQPRLQFFRRMAALESSLHGHLWPIFATAMTFLIALNGGRIGSRVVMDAQFSAQRMPVGAVAYLREHDAGASVLSPDFWGGYVIYRLYPGTRVVVDDRHDFYGEPFFQSYLKMIHLEPGWQDFLHEHAGSYVLMPTKAALTSALLASGRRPVYADEVATVFPPFE